MAVRKTAKWEKVIALALCGYAGLSIARQVKVNKETVQRWLGGIGLDISREDGITLPCPECGGRMVKQPLFYWNCQCGAEWWPPDKFVPDDPDAWNATCRLEASTEASVLGIIEHLHNEGKTNAEIAEALNQAGYTTALGVPWTDKNISRIIVEKIRPGNEERKRIEEICRTMALEGYNCREIADRLNAAGFKRPRRKQPWNKHAVYKLIRQLLPDLQMKNGHHGIGPVTLPDRMKDSVHPWRRDEEICHAKAKARRKK